MYTSNIQIVFLGQNDFNKNRLKIFWFINREIRGVLKDCFLLIYSKTPPVFDPVEVCSMT